MLEISFLKNLAIKNQISEISIYREYCQHLFLSYFYSKQAAENYLFKGGTALRIVFQSPRYSEDLDFSASSVDTIEDLILSVLKDLKEEGLEIKEIPVSKKTSGGYISFLNFSTPLFESQIKINIQQKDSGNISSSSKLVSNEFVAPYTIVYLKDELLIREKIEAFLNREKAKERDFFDLYFILNSDYLRSLLKKDNELKAAILNRLEALSDNELRNELKNLLPINYHNLLADSNLTTQIKKLINLYL